MEPYEAKVLDIPEEGSEYSLTSLSQEHLAVVVEHLNFPPEQAHALATNSIGLISNEFTLDQLNRAFKEDNLEALPHILESIKLEVIQIDKCQLLRLRQPNTEPLNEKHINWLRTKIGPHYPDDISGHTLTLIGPNGKQLQLKSWDLIEARQFDQIFNQYLQWFEEQKNWIGPRFHAIKQELGDWLLKKLNLEGMNPQKDSFVNWFVSNKLGTIELSLDLSFDQSSKFIIPSSSVPVRLNVKKFTRQLTSDVIATDFVEYLLWLEREGNNSLLQGKDIFQKGLGERFINQKSILGELKTDTQSPGNNIGEKPKRINSEARDKHAAVLAKYDKYIKEGFVKTSAIQKLVHDFRFEYAPESNENRKRQIKRIIKNRDN